MKDENTICYKISESIKDIDHAIQTGELNAGPLGKRLHDIRHDAQTMENALKLRKEIMIKNNCEEEYKNEKAKRLKIEGINEIAHIAEETHEQINFEFIVKQDGKVVYQNFSHAGVVCIVEKIKDMDNYGQINGQTQVFHFGNILAVFFAFDQLRQAMEGKKIEIMAAIKDRMMNKKSIDPEVKQRIINETNK